LHEEGEKSTKVLGYIQEFGVTVNDEKDILPLIKDEVSRQDNINSCQIIIERVGLIENMDIDIMADEDVKNSLEGNPKDFGVWYRTGRGYDNV